MLNFPSSRLWNHENPLGNKALKARRLRYVTLKRRGMKHEVTIRKWDTNKEIWRKVEVCNSLEVSSTCDESRAIPLPPHNVLPSLHVWMWWQLLLRGSETSLVVQGTRARFCSNIANRRRPSISPQEQLLCLHLRQGTVLLDTLHDAAWWLEFRSRPMFRHWQLFFFLQNRMCSSINLYLFPVGSRFESQSGFLFILTKIFFLRCL